jgi:hypothetical protein
MKIPLQTTNLALGIALYLAGVKPWRNKYFAMIVYDEKTLDNLGVSSVKQALDTNRCGERVMNFDLSDAALHQSLSEIWDDERKRIDLNMGSDIKASPEDVVRIAARVLHCRKQLTQKWQDLPIFAHVANGDPQTEEAEGESFSVHPGFKMVSVRASQSTMADLGFANHEEEGDDEEA